MADFINFSFGCRLEIHKEITLDHAVIEFTLFVCAVSVAFLKIGIRGQIILAQSTPACQTPEAGVNLLRRLAIEQTFSIGWVREEDAVHRIELQAERVPRSKGNK